MKCAAYLQRGVGLAIVDIVTSRRANLHNELVAMLQFDDSVRMADDTVTYAVGYRPLRRDDREEIDMWQQPLILGEELPTVPLGLSGIDVVPLDLEATYQSVCRPVDRLSLHVRSARMIVVSEFLLEDITISSQ